MYKRVSLHKKKSNVLIVHCSDPRFQDAHRSVIDQIKQYYDLLVLPGPSKAIAERPEVIDDIKLLHSLHDFEIIHILDHIQCAAFGKVSDEIIDHSNMVMAAKKKLQAAIPGVDVKGHLLGEDKELELKLKR